MADQQAEFKRQTAYKTDIASLNSGKFVKKEGWESNYVMTQFGNFSRVNIIGVVVGRDDSTITIDDGTGQISGRMFERQELLEEINIGDAVTIIARPREYSGNMYLTIEIIKRIDRRWLNYRKKELGLIKPVRDKEQIQKQEKHVEATIIESERTANTRERIVNAISSLDKGDGAIINDVLQFAGIGNAEEIISDMIMRGECYESKPGHIKLML